MWIDKISEIDILNYQPYCNVLMDIIYDVEIDNATIGLYGNWGSGKSTILNFLLKNIDRKKYGCININAWIFEGYEDIKRALIKSIIEEIEEHSSLYNVQVERIQELKKRTDFLKIGSYILPSVINIVLKLIFGNLVPSKNFFEKIKHKLLNTDIKIDIDDLQKRFIKDIDDENNNVKNIRLFRKSFEETLKESKLEKLIIIIDDLDRCTPEKIIECLEAVKLFLSVEKVIFVIAVDNRIVEYAVKERFKNIDGLYNIQKDYLNKIIEIPIYIHQLQEKDLSDYMIQLVIQKHIDDKKFEKMIKDTEYLNIFKHDILEQKDLIIMFLNNNNNNIYKEKSTKELLIQDLYIIDEIRGVVSGCLSGSPREAKKFLNDFFVRKKLLQLYFVNDIKLPILAKLMALEIIEKPLYDELYRWAFEYTDTIEPLQEIIYALDKNENIPEALSIWNDEKVIKWLKMYPKNIYNENLKKYFYLSKDYGKVKKDIVISCKECGKKFIFTAEEQEFYNEKGFEELPASCRECRILRKEKRINRRFNKTDRY